MAAGGGERARQRRTTRLVWTKTQRDGRVRVRRRTSASLHMTQHLSRRALLSYSGFTESFTAQAFPPKLFTHVYKPDKLELPRKPSWRKSQDKNSERERCRVGGGKDLGTKITRAAVRLYKTYVSELYAAIMWVLI